MKWEQIIFVTILVMGMSFSIVQTHQKEETKTLQTNDSSILIKEMAATAGH